jgi:hypothetical protein
MGFIFIRRSQCRTWACESTLSLAANIMDIACSPALLSEKFHEELVGNIQEAFFVVGR